jgi:Ran GTPase-activating protein (RanGAP) involved in mRNA processing and transport
MPACLLLSVPEDVLCSLVPECRVLMMSRTCTSMFKMLTARSSPVHVTVRKKVLTDSRLARQFTAGMHTIQSRFQIRRFECVGFSNGTRCVELNLCEFEDLTFLHLQHLKMHHNQLRDAHLQNLLHMLAMSHDLRSFEFTQQSLRSRHMPALCDAISAFANLEVLNIEHNFFFFDGLAIVLDAVTSSSIGTLKLSTNSCHDTGTTLKLCRVISCNCTCLRVLELSFMRLRNSAFACLASALGSCVLLESLDLSQNQLHCGSLIEILESTKACEHLQSFNWSGNRLGSTGTFLLANHIANSDACKRNLRELKLRSCDAYTNMQTLTEALTMCESLRSLDISSNYVLAHEVLGLLKITGIRLLDISDNNISDSGMRVLLRPLMQSSTLKELRIDGNHLTRRSIRLLRKMSNTKGVRVQLPLAACPCLDCKNA